MKKISLLILVVCFSITNRAEAQRIIPELFKKKVEGTILLKEGRKLNGKFKIPTAKKKTISFFDESKEKKEIPSDNIKALHVKNEEGNFSTLIYTSIGMYLKSKKGLGVKEKKNKFWLLEFIDGKKAKLYVVGNRFKQAKNGNIIAIADGNAGGPGVLTYYAKMERRDKFPVFVDTSMNRGINGNVFFKKYGSFFFQGVDNALSAKIKNKEKGYKAKNRNQIFLDFNGL